MNRRQILGASAATLALMLTGQGSSAAARFEVTKSDEEWLSILGPAKYRVLREEGTERAFSSPLNDEKRAGTFHCAGCDLPLYASGTKFDSGTGWPSFWDPLPNAVETRVDWGILGRQTEAHCRRCGGHLGHVFDDGPKPTGKRYCMNGLALTFRAA